MAFTSRVTIRHVRAWVTALTPALFTIAWVIGMAMIAISIGPILVSYPTVALIAVYGFAILGGLGGLVGVWYSADGIEFLVRGYQVRWENRTHWRYEEYASDGSIQCLLFGYQALGPGYRPPCEVALPSELRWRDTVPPWARDRRHEIMGNIAQALGADIGTSIRFVDSDE